ncbi:hypothetical protein [Halobacillus sp. K22]|uniref:hypothetical protein n=1 Tax=Halobacillus sp. K22 TaxID=3457431 RepID=UPI003FCE619C
MKRNYVITSVMIGLAVFVISWLVLAALGSPAPYLGGLVVAFIIFEISFYHLFARNREGNN